MSHIVESCPLTKLNGGLSQLHVTKMLFPGCVVIVHDMHSRKNASEIYKVTVHVRNTLSSRFLDDFVFLPSMYTDNITSKSWISGSFHCLDQSFVETKD